MLLSLIRFFNMKVGGLHFASLILIHQRVHTTREFYGYSLVAFP